MSPDLRGGGQIVFGAGPFVEVILSSLHNISENTVLVTVFYVMTNAFCLFCI